MTEQEIKDLQAENAKMKADLATAQKLNKTLQDEIVEQERATAPAAQAVVPTLLPEKPVTIGKKKYKITFPRFSYKGKEYTAAQAAKDSNLLEELLEINFGGLEEVA